MREGSPPSSSRPWTRQHTTVLPASSKAVVFFHYNPSNIVHKQGIFIREWCRSTSVPHSYCLDPLPLRASFFAVALEKNMASGALVLSNSPEATKRISRATYSFPFPITQALLSILYTNFLIYLTQNYLFVQDFLFS